LQQHSTILHTLNDGQQTTKIKMKYTLAIITALGIGLAAQAQTIDATQISALLSQGVIKVGTANTINGVSFIATTNASGGYSFQIISQSGSVSYTPPTAPGGALNQASQWINANQSTNADYYGTNDIEAKLGALYLQNSGQALIDIAVTKYGLIKSMPQFGVGVDLLQGNKSGVQSTAGADGTIGYRKVIGDVAAEFDAGGGYDNWAKKPCGLAKALVEYRSSNHLGAYVGLSYFYEGMNVSTVAGDNIAGLGVVGGVTYSF
jgi:hypothetical protein